MSKRKALLQGSKETGLDDDREEKMSGNESNTPRRATAAQLAARKIAGPRARGRVGAAGPIRPPGSSLPPPNPNPFGSIDPNAVNSGANQQNSLPSFNFGQTANHQPNGNIFGQTQSQSFPQTTSGSVLSTQNGPNSFGGFGSGNNSSFNFNLPNNSSGFQFPQTQQNSNNTNVFGSNGTSLGGSSQPASTGFSGFQGSLFNIPSGSAPTEQNNVSTSAPSTSIFGQPTANHSPSNPFVSLNPSSTPSNNLFGNPSSTQPAPQPSPNSFGNQPTLTPTTSVFGNRPIDESYSPQPPASNTESSNANASTSTDLSSRAIAHPRNFIPPPPDRMQTSPDGTPAKTVSPAKPNPWTSLATSLNSTAMPSVGATSTDSTATGNKIFASQGGAGAQPPPGPTSTPTPSTNPLLGGRVTKPAESSTTQAGSSNPLFGARITKPESAATPATSGGFNFGAQSNTSVFGNKTQSTSTTSAAPSLFATSTSTPTTANLFGSVGTTHSALPATSSSSNTPAPSTPAPPNSILKQKKPSLSKVAEGKKPARDDSPQPFSFAAPSSAPSGNMFSAQPSQTAASSSLVPTSTQIAPQASSQGTVPAHWDSKMKGMYTQGHKLRSLNHGFQKWIGNANPNSAEFDNVIRFYLHKRAEMGLLVELDTLPPLPPVAGSKRKPSDDPSSEGGPGNNKRARSNQPSPQTSTPTPAPSSSSTRTFGAAPGAFSFLSQPKANAAATGSGGALVKSDAAPTSSNVAPTSNTVSTGINFAFGTSNGPSVFGQAASTTSNGVSSSRPTVPMPTPSASRASTKPSRASEVSSSPLKTKKRPATEEEDQDADEQSRKRNKNDEHNEDQSASGSHTSSMFKDMLNKPTSDNGASNDVSASLSQQPAASSTETPGLNAVLNPAQGPRPSVSASASSITNYVTPTRSGRSFFGPPRVNGTTPSNPFGSQPTSSQTGSSTPLMFGSASQNLNGSSAPSTTTPLFGASQNSNGSASTVFGSQPAQSSLSTQPSDGTTSTTSVPTNTTATPAATSNASSSAGANVTSAATSNPGSSANPPSGFNFFTGQPATGGSGVKLPTFAPPTFGGGAAVTNFADQFAASAEKAAMEQAMKADYDSEEHGTEEQWMEIYKKEQKAKAEKMEKERKAVDFKFVEGEGFSFSEREDGPDDAASESDAHSAQAAPSNPFQPKPSPLSQDTIPPPPKNQHLSAVFNSGASTPSTTGGASVFDEPRSTGLQVPNAANPFGHLSDVESGVDSKTGDADDEDDSGEEDSGSENSPKNGGDSGSDGGSSHDSDFADGPNRYDERTLRRFDNDDEDDDGERRYRDDVDDDDDDDGDETRDYPEDEDDGDVDHGDQDSSGYGDGEPDSNGESDSFMNDDDSLEHDSMFVEQEDSINNDSIFNEQDSPLGEAAPTGRPLLGFGEISFLDTPAWERIMQAKHVKECEREARAFNEAYSGRAERIESLNIIPRVGLLTSSSTTSRSESNEPVCPNILPIVQPSKPTPPVVQPGNSTHLQARSAIPCTAVRESGESRYAKKDLMAANLLSTFTSEANNTDRPEPGRGIFARLQYDDNGHPMKAPAKESKTEEEGNKAKKPLYPTFDFLNPPGKRKSDDDSDGQPGSVKAQKKDESSSPGPSSVFGQSSSQNPFGQSRFQPSSSIFDSQPSGDNTWTPQTPIRFGGAPAVSVTSPSPTPAATTPLPTFNFASSTQAVGVPGSLFGQSTSTSTSTPTPSLGFNFGAPRTQASMLAAESAADSMRSSRASSPGMTTDTGGETDADSEVVEQHAQANFMSREGEEDEDILFEVKAKAMWFGQNQTKDGDQITLSPGAWQNRGIGPLRLLKSKTTGKCRILQRQEPSGRIVINSGLIPSYSYDYQVPKGVKLVLLKEDKFETWVLKVGSEEKAQQLSQLLQQHKSD